MVLVVTPDQQAHVDALMRAFLEPVRDVGGWMRHVVAQADALTGAPCAMLVTLADGKRMIEGDRAEELLAARLADAGSPAPPSGVRVHAVAAGLGTSHAIVEMAAHDASTGMHGLLACRVRSDRSAIGAKQAAELLRLTHPVFEFAIGHQFPHRAGDAERPRWGLDAVVATTRRLIAALDEPCAYCTLDGDVCWRNGSMDELLSGEPDHEALLREIADSARLLAGEQGSPAGGGTMRVDVCTGAHRYRVRLVLLSRRADVPGAIAVIVLRRTEVTGEMVVQLSDRYGLTARELEVARLLLHGQPNDAIARSLGISAHTARHHTQRVLEKIGVRSRAQVASVAARARLSGEHRRRSVGVREVVIERGA